MRNTTTVILALALCLGGVSQLEAQTPPWVFGIGTGIGRVSSEGDQGFNTSLYGPIEAHFDLTPDDFKDHLRTGIGFSTFLSNGTWMFKFFMATIELGGTGASTLEVGTPFTADARLDLFTTDFSVAYTLYRSPGNKFALRPHVGTRYTKQELALALTVMEASGDVDVPAMAEANWTDFLVGTSVDISLVPKLGWNTVFDAGFGVSNRTYRVVTALSWRVWSHFSLSPNASFTSNDYENGTKGDADWYLWDAETTSYGLAGLFTF